MDSNVRIIYDPEKNGDPHRLSMENFQRMANLMDSRFEIPGTRIRFGLDPLLSLLPFLGDLITLLVSGVLIYHVYTHGASRKVVIKMMLNSVLDTIIGAIPLVGTVFDVFYRSNERNVRLLREHYFEGKHQGSGSGLLVTIVLFAVLVIAGVIYGIWKIMEAIF